jgi:hypothetical protein
MRDLIRFFLLFCLVLWSLPVLVADDRIRFDWVAGDEETPKPGLGLAVPEITWDEDQLTAASGAVSEAAAAAAQASPDFHIVQLTSPQCTKCQPAWQVLQVALVRNGWTFGPGKWFRQETVAFNRPLPAYQLRVGSAVLKEWPAGVKPEELALALSDAVTTPRAAKPKIERPASAFTVGSLKAREQVAALLATMRPLLGNGGKLSIDYSRNGADAPFVLAGVRIQIPAKTRIDWTMRGEVLQVSFSQPITFSPVQWPTSFTVTGFAIGETSVTMQMPWMIDMRIGVE